MCRTTRSRSATAIASNPPPGAGVPDLPREPLEGDPAVLLSLDPRDAERVGALPLLEGGEGPREDGGEQRDDDEELGKRHASERRRRHRPRQCPSFLTACGRRSSRERVSRRPRATSNAARIADDRLRGVPPDGDVSVAAGRG